MNENKTAITEMREWLENQYISESSYDYKLALRYASRKARALEASQAEKDEGVKDELKKCIKASKQSGVDEFGNYWLPVAVVENILSRHEKGAK